MAIHSMIYNTHNFISAYLVIGLEEHCMSCIDYARKIKKRRGTWPRTSSPTSAPGRDVVKLMFSDYLYVLSYHNVSVGLTSNDYLWCPCHYSRRYHVWLPKPGTVGKHISLSRNMDQDTEKNWSGPWLVLNRTLCRSELLLCDTLKLDLCLVSS